MDQSPLAYGELQARDSRIAREKMVRRGEGLQGCAASLEGLLVHGSDGNRTRPSLWLIRKYDVWVYIASHELYTRATWGVTVVIIAV